MIINENKTKWLIIGTKEKLSELLISALAINVHNIHIENVDNDFSVFALITDYCNNILSTLIACVASYHPRWLSLR